MSALLAVTESSPTSFPVLSALIILPGIGAAVVALVSRGRPEIAKSLAVLFSVATAALGLWLVVDFDRAAEGFQFVERTGWIDSEGLDISWVLGVDGISLFLVALTVFLFPLSILAINPEHDPKPYYAWLLLLEAGSLGVFLALDLFVFFVFFEVVLVPMYFLIGRWGHGDRTYAAVKFFVFTAFGSALMLVGMLVLAVLSARELGGPITFDLVALAESQALATNTARWVFLSFAVAFAIKVPIFPVHTWLPDAHTNAPTAGSVILAGVMLKLGTYAFLRYGLFLFPEASDYFAPLFLTLGVIGIVYGAIVATMQVDLKRLVAYSSVAHMGFVVLGVFALTTESMSGGVIQMVNHGLSTGALFVLVGMIYERRHTREISQLSGLQKAAPILAAAFTLVMLSSIGLPGLNGFVGEFLILVGTFSAHRWWAVIAATGVILAALYLLWGYQRVFQGPTRLEANEKMADVNPREALGLLAFIVPIVFLGVYPKPVLERIEPAVDELLAHVERNVSDFEAPTVPEVEEIDPAELGEIAEEGEGEGGGEGTEGGAEDGEGALSDAKGRNQ